MRYQSSETKNKDITG